MTMNSSGPISLAGTTAGVSIEIENGGNGTTQISLNCASVRTLAGVPSGAITMPTNFYGKANQFNYTISSNQTNFCMRAGAVSAGWNGSSKLVVTINSGVIISANSTGANAMTIQGSYAGGVSVKNNGTIVGMGGGGGHGGANGGVTGGASGGTALKISSTVTICNASGIIAGGGGGGGGSGGSAFNCCGLNVLGGGGGGGGRSSNAANSAGGGGGIGNFGSSSNGASGGTGTYSSAGGGGAPACTIYGGGGGGGGGGWGSSGGNGSTYSFSPSCSGQSGGGGGKATCGSSFVTWTATGTRYGSIS